MNTSPRKSITTADKARFRQLLAQSGNILDVCRQLGRTPNSFYQQRETDKDFAEAWANALEEFAAQPSKDEGGRVSARCLDRARKAAAAHRAVMARHHAEVPLWEPQDGPQRQAYESEADILFYGGAAGGGKSDLLIGLALTQHKDAIIFRREYTQLKALEERVMALTRETGRYNNVRRVLRFKHHAAALEFDRRLEFGAVQKEADMHRFQGRAHDLKGFDEITHFTESQFRYLIGWNRSPDPDQRVRVVCAGNPPDGPEGDWVIKFWGPWLDKTHPNPARPGELRWYAQIDGEEREVPDGTPVDHDGEIIQPTSRGFIPARVEDNKYMMQSGYKARLQSLPEPLRSRLLHGDFGVAQSDEPNQLIPTAWVRRAMDRWSRCPPESMEPMTHLGVDVARGGQDRTVIAIRHGVWFDWLKVWPGRDTPDGKAVTEHLVNILSLGDPGANTGEARLRHALVQVDVVGVGGAVHDMARMAGLTSVPLSSAAASRARDRTGQLSFINRRAEWWWKLREALDPDLGLALMLPPDRELLADLTAPRWDLTAHGIRVENKEAIRQRIGRSTDKGDALIYAWASPQESGLLAYARVELAKQRARAAATPRETHPTVVARTTFGQPHFAFNPDGTRRPEIEPLDPATVRPGRWWRFTRHGRFELLDPWARYNRR